MTKNTNDPILPIRFRINDENLKQQRVSVFNLPWMSELNQVLSYLNEKESGKTAFYDKPPYTTLNAAIASLSPVIAHGFIKIWDRQSNVEKRQMMGLEKVPSEKMLKEIFYAWADRWINFRFSELSSSHRDYALRMITESLAKPYLGWVETDAYQALHGDDRVNKYRVLPSVLASMMSGKTSLINNVEVQWGLSLYDDDLIVVSNPQLSSWTDQDGKVFQGTFAYSVKFTMQTQAGDETPWIHAEIRCQRYIDHPVKRLNYGRMASVLVQMSQTRKEGWPYSETLIQMPILGGHKNPRYSDYLPEILEYLNARPLENPKNILAEPISFRNERNEVQDKYYIVHAEGYRPKHDLKSGFSPREKAEVVQAILNIFGDTLEPGRYLSRDQRTSISNPIPLLNWPDLQKRSIMKMRGIPKEERDAIKAEHQINFRFEAMKRALKGKKARVIILYSNDQTRQAIDWAIRRTFLLSKAEHFPDWFQIQSSPIPGNLTEPICKHIKSLEELNRPGTPYREKERQKRNFKKDMRYETNKRIDDWVSFLEPIVSPSRKDEVVFLIAELLDLPDGYDESQSIHHIIRAASVKTGCASQMITSIEVPLDDIKLVDAGKIFSGKPVEARSRALSAVRDLLLRQSGIVGEGLVEKIYRQASNLPDQISDDLVVIGVYRRRTNGFNAVDFPMAVRLNPDGCCEAKIPGSDWIDYLDASLQIGSKFLSQKNYRLKQEELSQFLNEIVTDQETITHNTLLLVLADNWRTGVWSGLSNPKLQINHFLLDKKDSPIQKPLTPDNLTNLRIVRLREAGTLGETPQYVCSKETSWHKDITADNVRGGGGFIDDDHHSKGALHYFSIGDLDSIKDEDLGAFKSEEGGGKAYRMESIIEMLPIFYQPSDANSSATGEDELPIYFRYCRVAHFLRHSPAWDGGTTNYPYPLHLASACIDDMLCLLGAYTDDEAE